MGFFNSLFSNPLGTIVDTIQDIPIVGGVVSSGAQVLAQTGIGGPFGSIVGGLFGNNGSAVPSTFPAMGGIGSASNQVSGFISNSVSSSASGGSSDLMKIAPVLLAAYGVFKWRTRNGKMIALAGAAWWFYNSRQ